MGAIFIFLLWGIVGKGLYKAILHSNDTYRQDK